MVCIVNNRLNKTFVTILSAVLSFIFALLVGAIIIKATGSSPLHTYGVLLKGAWGSKNAISESLIKASILLLTGLSFTFASKCGLINIGAEGQLYMGAASGITVGIYLTGLPAYIHLPLALLAGFAGGAIWGSVVGILKARFNSNEIITSIMLNYIAIQFVSFLVNGPIKDKTQSFPYSYMVQDSAKLPIILQGTRLHIGVFVALACLVFYWFFYRYTVTGYRLRVIGQNRRCAEYAGFNVRKSMFWVILIGGGFAGLGGAIEVLGIQHRLFENFSVGYGFDGIAASLLAGGNPIGMFFTALLFGSLKNGANSVQMFTSVPSSLVEIVQAVVIITVIMKVFSRKPKLPRFLTKAGRAAAKKGA